MIKEIETIEMDGQVYLLFGYDEDELLDLEIEVIEEGN